MQKKALFIAAFDSQLKWCGGIRDEFRERGFETEVVAPNVRSELSPNQIRDAGFTEVATASWAELLERALESDVVVCSLSGPVTKAFCFALAERAETKTCGTPVVVTGWVGVIIEKIVAGYLDRCGSDIIAVNAVSDLALFSDVAARLALPADNLLLAGLPFISSSPQPAGTGPIRRVLFADQPTVPSSELERLYVYRQVIDYAVQHPERDVLLKPRHRPEEDTFHRMRYHPEHLLAAERRPPNFRIDYTPISGILPQVDLLLTMSSTAVLEALDAGCRVGLVLDLGVHERYGNHVFLDSGLLRTFADLKRDDIGTPESPWFDSYFFSRERTAAQRIADRAEQLLDEHSRPSRAVWTSSYFVSAGRTHREVETAGSLSDQPSRRYGTVALRRRQLRHGQVWGTLAHLSSALLPPILHQPLQSVSRRSGWLT